VEPPYTAVQANGRAEPTASVVEVLSQLAGVIAARSELPAVVELIVDRVSALLGTGEAHLLLAPDQAGQVPHVVAARPQQGRPADPPAQVLAHGAHALARREILVSRTSVAVPLPVSHDPVAVLVCSYPDGASPHPADLTLWRLVGDLAGAALRNVRSAEGEQRRMHALGERIKELLVLHGTARTLQDGRDLRAQLREVTGLLAAGWQYPEVTAVRICLGGLEVTTDNWTAGPWVQRAQFRTQQGEPGLVEVAYLRPCPDEAEGPFLREERELIDSVAELLRLHVDRQQAWAQLRAERERLRAILDQMPDGIVLTDAQGRVQLVNRAALRVARDRAPDDQPRSDLFGNRVIFDVRLPSGAPATGEALPLVRAVCKGETVTGVELQVRPAGGEPIPVVASAAPVRAANGSTLGCVAVFHEVTRLKELDRLRQEWTSVVVHDLRQPIATILMSAMLLERSATSDRSGPERRAVAHIVNNGRRLDRMVNDLLDVSRIEAGRLELRTETVDLRALVQQVLEWTADLTAGRPVRVSAPRALPGLVADRGRLEQVVWNLLSNAVKYGSPDREILVELAAEGDAVELAISNGGSGIGADELPLLFNRFFRTRDAQHGSAGGLGLGLYIIKGIVEAHGGSIAVESVPADRTTFRLRFPVGGLHDGHDRRPAP
jgi:signal transduction histidine kinase